MTFTARSLISKIFYEVTIAAIRRVDNVVHGQITELHVQTIKLTAETKIAVLAALYAYALAPEILVTIRKHDDNPRVIALIIESWPPDEDGKFTIGLLFTHLTILWRAWALYEIAAGRGLHKNSEEYAAKLGIKIIPAFDYVARRLKGTGSRSTNGDRTAWTNGFKWVRYDGNVEKPWKKFASSAWRGRANAHTACVASGLALPGRDIWNPQATMLFATPEEQVATTTLAKVDADALANFCSN
jgi:hypothetical protein